CYSRSAAATEWIEDQRRARRKVGVWAGGAPAEGLRHGRRFHRAVEHGRLALRPALQATFGVAEDSGRPLHPPPPRARTAGAVALRARAGPQAPRHQGRREGGVVLLLQGFGSPGLNVAGVGGGVVRRDLVADRYGPVMRGGAGRCMTLTAVEGAWSQTAL